ncbi:MAG: hypothetical protein QOH70_134 [Blastocatellia bacterium]|jgi:hypothetical protein|nr:hypothetical protein [Blastocatellia bacterium]
MRVSIWRFGAACSQGVGWPSLKGKNMQTAKAARTSKHQTVVGVSGKEISSVVLHGVFFVGSSAALARMQRSFYFCFD